MRAATDDSARGRHEVQKSLPTGCDLIRQRPLERATGPQPAAVVQVHGQRAEAVAIHDRGVEYPWRMVTAVGLISLEPNGERLRVANSSNHSQTLAARQGAESGAKLDIPCVVLAML